MKHAKIEKRACSLELRAASDGKIVGYAAVFNKLSQDLGGFREKIAPGAFAESIKNDDIRALHNHDSNYVLGRNTSGTLRLYEDKKGLRVEIIPPNSQWAKDLRESIRREDVNQMSFAFTALDDTWEENGRLRILNKVRLHDVSVVTYPAYENTEVQANEHSRTLSKT